MVIAAGTSTAALGQPVPYRAKRLFLGCWTQLYPPGPRRPHGGETTLCFQPGRTVGGVSVLFRGEGGDFCERWRVAGQRVWLYDFYGNTDKCLYDRSYDRTILTLGDCGFKGEWKSDGRADQQHWPCRKHASDLIEE